VIRQHPETVSVRYLAPPVALVAVVAGALVGGAGLAFGSGLLKAGFALPGGYLAGILAGSLVGGRALPPAALVRLPVVFATMHGCWAVGFLTSPRSLAEGGQGPVG
jgi:succinoglycan biosynthesis protein ExoA